MTADNFLPSYAGARWSFCIPSHREYHRQTKCATLCNRWRACQRILRCCVWSCMITEKPVWCFFQARRASEHLRSNDRDESQVLHSEIGVYSRWSAVPKPWCLAQHNLGCRCYNSDPKAVNSCSALDARKGVDTTCNNFQQLASSHNSA